VTLAGKNRDESYANTGKCVVSNSDILVAVWDRKPENGVGGTVDIVKYAEKKGKQILYIDAERLN
jgi:predicted secreted acid phosphatase